MLTKVWAETKNLLFPLQCPGCGKWDVAVCSDCARVGRGPATSGTLVDNQGVPDHPLHTLGRYEGALRGLILTAKHQENHALNPFLRQAGITLGAAVAGTFTDFDAVAFRLAAGSAARPAISSPAHEPAPLWVVPAPSSHARRRSRREIVPLIATSAAVSLSAWLGRPAHTVAAVALQPGLGGQEGRGKEERSAGRLNSMRLAVTPPPGTQIVVVDDVVTTGATVRELVRVLHPHVAAVAALAEVGA